VTLARAVEVGAHMVDLDVGEMFFKFHSGIEIKNLRWCRFDSFRFIAFAEKYLNELLFSKYAAIPMAETPKAEVAAEIQSIESHKKSVKGPALEVVKRSKALEEV
jgi:hypothetical protein